jgi:hypothetical protein
MEPLRLRRDVGRPALSDYALVGDEPPATVTVVINFLPS